jgi:acyl-CoA reductase-like NAD-dependent aldehyde dehydrogenase
MPKHREPVRLDVRKMHKLFVNGAFVRSESARSDQFETAEGSVNVARASRKDLRDAVGAARAALPRWSGLDPANRGLILYRLAEMIESQRDHLAARLRSLGEPESEAVREVDAAIDRTVWYAGWCDKYAALVSSRNPVAGPYVSLSAPTPVGVVGVVAPDSPGLLGLVSTVVPPLVAGNTVVAVASEIDPFTAVAFAECLATCDLPAGAANILTGKRIELAPHLARHMDVDALDAVGLDRQFSAELERMSSENLKRTRLRESPARAAWLSAEMQSLDDVTAFTETKTIWHPTAI